MSLVHDWTTNSWRLSFRPGDTPEAGEYITLEETLPATPWSVTCVCVTLPVSGGVGLVVMNDDGPMTYFLARASALPIDAGTANPWSIEVLSSETVTLRLDYNGFAAKLWYSLDDAATWVDVNPGHNIPMTDVVKVGAVLRYDTPLSDITTTVAEYQVLPGEWENVTTEMTVGPVAPGIPVEPPEPPTMDEEAIVHALVGAQFGDLEFDVGKSVRWSQWFTDDVYITDINTGTQRYWVVNWSESFPNVEHDVVKINFFMLPEEFRYAQFHGAFSRMQLDDSDWVLFVDAHEGMSVDARSQPDDVAIAPFRSYIYREIARAEDASLDRVVIPLYVFLRHDDIRNVSYVPDGMADGADIGIGPVRQSVGTPYYLPHMGLTRLIRVSALVDPDFDWSVIDTPVDVVDPTVKVQLISYGYAHWSVQDIVPPDTEVPDTTEANDYGWQMRNLISQVRPIPGLPIGPWQDPAADPTGEPGPDPCDPSWADPGTPADITWEGPDPPPPTAATEAVLAPLYHTVFRINLRDGLFWEAGTLGNIPLVWDTTEGKWVPVENPEDWAKAG